MRVWPKLVFLVALLELPRCAELLGPQRGTLAAVVPAVAHALGKYHALLALVAVQGLLAVGANLDVVDSRPAAIVPKALLAAWVCAVCGLVA